MQSSFQVKLMSKDLKLALAAAKLSGTELIVGKTTADVYGEMEKSDEYATKDFSSVFKMLSRASTA
jgi:3-hydroxyisobutyrate dehydrogenase-like beta-hydroxyacid dehydrogenase